MLLSLLKIVFFFALVLAIALGATELAQSGQNVRIEFNGTEYLLGPLQAIAAVIVLMLVAWLAFKVLGLVLAFLRFLAGDETALSRHFARSRERKGFEALGEGMLAVAAGEGREAQDKAAKAEKYLDRPHMTNLLAAQAAEVAGDKTRAGEVYRRLLEDDRTRFVGIRGLLRQKLEEGDTSTALQLAQRAYAMKPRHNEVQNTLLELQTRQGDWKGARGVLKDKRKQGDLPKDVHLRRDAVLALQEAKEILDHGNSISAREAAISANRASPDLIPAAVLAARSYIAQKDLRNASRVLEKTWSVRPHPDIASTYAEVAPDETPTARLRRFESLMRKNPDHEETRLLKAELLLAVEDFPGARRALGDLAQEHPTVRSLAIMAAVERGQGADDAVVRGWLAKALGASRGPQWVCDSCEHVMSEWGPVCNKCGGFDTLSWTEPDTRQSAGVPSGAEMLPLLIGPKSAPQTHQDTPKPKETAPEKEAITKVETAEEAPKTTAAGMTDTVVPDAEVNDEGVPLLTEGAGTPTPAATRLEIPNVAPGMVPREEDYIAVDPSATVTTPEPHPIRTAEFDVPAREAENQAERDRASSAKARKA